MILDFSSNISKEIEIEPSENRMSIIIMFNLSLYVPSSTSSPGFKSFHLENTFRYSLLHIFPIEQSGLIVNEAAN